MTKPISSVNGRVPLDSGPRVLVVEDDRHSREGLRGLLRAGGYRVETAADGWEAIEHIKEGQYDFAIVDLDLPVVRGVAVDGWDVARIVRAFHPEVAVVLVSARGGADVETRARQLHVNAFLEKPINLAVLREAMTQLHSQAQRS
jgi:CheY-like chemotaxis protein